jgi:hypothetical protein
MFYLDRVVGYILRVGNDQYRVCFKWTEVGPEDLDESSVKMRGLHLSGVPEKIIPDTVGDLKQFGLELLAPGHCTGWRALTAMAKTFADELVSSAVGKRYLI